MTQVYSNPKRESDPHALPNVEVFYMSDDEIESYGHDSIWLCPDDGFYMDSGWYYWHCFPGCLPDGDPVGAFETEQDAIDDAQADAWQFEDED
jgi:hypothetical protein